MTDDEPQACGEEAGHLYCGEPPHDGDWHYDQYDDVTFRAGNHLAAVRGEDGQEGGDRGE